MCTVHYSRAPVTSAIPQVWNQNSLVVQNMFISSHEIEHLFSNEAQRLIYQQLQLLRNMRSVADCSLVHPPPAHSPLISSLLSQLTKLINLVPLTFFVTTAHICTTTMRFDHDNFYRHLSNCQPHHTVHILVVSTMVLTITTTHNTALGATVLNTLPLPSKSQRTHLTFVNVHNTRPIDSSHFAQPMSHNNTYRSPTLVHLHHNSPANSTHIVS